MNKKEKLIAELKKIEDSEKAVLKKKETSLEEIPVPKPPVASTLKDHKDDKRYDPLKRKPFLKRTIENIKQSWFPGKVVLINMQLANGFFINFVVREKDGGFVYDKKIYMFDEKVKYYSLSSSLWCYDFHENLTMPYARHIDIEDIKSSLLKTSKIENPIVLNPTTLNKFLDSKIVEAIIQGAALGEAFKRIFLLLIITIVIVVLHFGVAAWKFGWFPRG